MLSDWVAAIFILGFDVFGTWVLAGAIVVLVAVALATSRQRRESRPPLPGGGR